MNPEAITRNFEKPPELNDIEICDLKVLGPGFGVEFTIHFQDKSSISFYAFDLTSLNINKFLPRTKANVTFRKLGSRFDLIIAGEDIHIEMNLGWLRVKGMRLV